MTMPNIDPKNETQKIIAFISSSFKKAGFSKAVIALSGGVDSSTSFVLAVRALGIENVYPVMMPYGALNTPGVLDAMTLVTELHVPIPQITRIDIRPAVDLILAREVSVENIRKGNVMARVRMTYLYDLAKKRNALVVGTENKSEHLLGYYTRFGDEASDVEPLRNLYKTQVYVLAKFLQIPESIISKKPTAGLWDGQTDEGEFGFTYQDADEILYCHFDKKESKEEIEKNGIPVGVIEKVLEFVTKNEFKHGLPLVPPDNESKK